MRYFPKPKATALPMRTKVDERREREEYDRKHPWHPMATAKAGPWICELRFADMSGTVETQHRYFLNEDDGRWYCIEPPSVLHRRPMEWRPTSAKLSPAKRADVLRRAGRSVYSGGRYIGDDPTW